MTLRRNYLQSDSDLYSICNSCDVLYFQQGKLLLSLQKYNKTKAVFPVSNLFTNTTKMKKKLSRLESGIFDDLLPAACCHRHHLVRAPRFKPPSVKILIIIIILKLINDVFVFFSNSSMILIIILNIYGFCATLGKQGLSLTMTTAPSQRTSPYQKQSGNHEHSKSIFV